jgi:maltose/moltooligosaccharide transporter
MMTNWFGVAGSAAGTIPTTVKLSFFVGAAAFLGAVLYTVVMPPRETPPPDMAAFLKAKAASKGPFAGASEIFEAAKNMPQTMKQLAVVQMATWLGLFCMWLFFSVAVARDVFGAPDANSPLYQQGIEWAGVCFGAYSAVTFVFSFFLPRIAAVVGRKRAHSFCLLCGAVGLLSVGFITNPQMLLLSMVGVGIAWCSILSMPYAILAGSLPANKIGVYMGIFNFFIVIPEIIASVGFGWVMNHVLNNNRLGAVIAGGVFLTVAALLTLRVNDVNEASDRAAARLATA